MTRSGTPKEGGGKNRSLYISLLGGWPTIRSSLGDCSNRENEGGGNSFYITFFLSEKKDFRSVLLALVLRGNGTAEPGTPS